MSGAAGAGEADDAEVWYEFLNSDRQSAQRVILRRSDFQDAVDAAEGDRLVWKPDAGLDGWTPMKEVLSQRASMESSANMSSDSTPARSSSLAQGVVTNVQRGIHVKQDDVSGGLSGLPQTWEGLMPEGCAPDSQPEASLPAALRPSTTPTGKLKDEMIIGRPFNVKNWRPQFGLPLHACETTRVNGYDVPSLLVTLWSTLKQNGGLAEEGIFRLAPDAQTCDALREALNTDANALERIGENTDPHVLANLIKIWFRMLPERLLSGISAEQLASCEGGPECMELLHTFAPPIKGLFLWLLDVMADVAAQRATNRMDERAIAIVVCPNLYDPPDAAALTDPLAAMAFTQGMAKFVTELLLHYVSVRTRVRSTSNLGVQHGGVPPPPPPPPTHEETAVDLAVDLADSGGAAPQEQRRPDPPAFC